MRNISRLMQLRKAHTLIKQGKTGMPIEFAKRMQISERSLFRLLDILKEMDAPICYNRRTFTYYYSSDFEFRLHFQIEILKGDELIKINAGSSCHFQKNCKLPSYGSGRIYI